MTKHTAKDDHTVGDAIALGIERSSGDSSYPFANPREEVVCGRSAVDPVE